MKPVLVDLFCGAGGAAKGYQEAGFYVIGVDHRPQPNYCGDEFLEADALDVLRALLAPKPICLSAWEHGERWLDLADLDAIHASPPCQAYSVLRRANPGAEYPELIPPVRELLIASGLPYVIENVPGAPTRHLTVLCGSMFGLGSQGRQLRQHRNFETSFPVLSPPCTHSGEAIGVYGGGPTARYTFENGVRKGLKGRRGGYQGTVAEKREAMGIDWMTQAELNQAIPPAYTKHIGSYLLSHIESERNLAA